MDEKFETACFQIITYVGTARTHFINAIQCAKEGKYDEAAELIKQGDEAFSLGHNAHADLLTMYPLICGNGIQVFPYKYCMDTYLPKW